MYVSRHVLFYEHQFPFPTPLPAPALVPSPISTPALLPFVSPLVSSSIPLPSPASSSSIPSFIQVPFASSSPSVSPLHNHHPMITHSKNGIVKKKAFLSSTATEPQTYQQASKDPNWVAAMEQEYSALLRNNTWTLVSPPPHAPIVGCRWVYKLKRKADGSIERFKARLVAKGYTQTHGLDYFETFSPVVKAATIRVILTLALSSHWTIHQLDVHNAFLHGDLSETVYMSQPPGFISSEFPQHVCKLTKALYGLKQAPRAWYTKLSNALVTWGFQSSRADTSLFFKHSASSILLLLIYVDDILITGSNFSEVSSFIDLLNSSFTLRDLGPINYFLGIEVHHSPGTLHLNQHKYIQDLLMRTGMEDSKPVSTPGSLGQNLSLHDGLPLFDVTQYRSVVGALQYVTITRPDIAFAVNKACQFMAAPTTTHWLAVKRILRYLKGTSFFGLQFHSDSSLDIHGFSNADWASSPDDRRSTSGYGIFLGSNLVSWTSHKQKVVSRSSAESEYRALASATAEIVWLHALLQELCIPVSSPATLWCDNKSASQLATNPVFHARTKHIELDLHFVRDLVLRKQLLVRHIPSLDQLVDVFTKHISSSQFTHFHVQLSIVPSPVSLREDERHNHQLTSASTET